MAKVFDKTIFNEEVFAGTYASVPANRLNALIKSKAFKQDPIVAQQFANQFGAFKATLPMKGEISANVLNNDGKTDITGESRDTFAQSYIVISRMKKTSEKDFSSNITGGVDFGATAEELAYAWETIQQDEVLNVLKGVFAMTGKDNLEFVNKHTYNAPVLNATSLNTAIQKASGDKKSNYSVVIMHSAVSTQLENINALNYLTYTDQQGIQRDLGLATWNGKLVVVDDSLPYEAGYVEATASTIGALKITATGSGANEVKKSVVEAAAFKPGTVVEGNYVLEAGNYTSYVIGEGGILLQEVFEQTPVETEREASKNGGVSSIITRKRFVIAPNGISFVGDIAGESPTRDELADGDNWSLVDNKQSGSNKKVYNHKNIAIAQIKTIV